MGDDDIVPVTVNVGEGGNSKSDHATSSSVGSSPAFGPSKPTCLRSLLMEPDMEDLTAIIPRTLDFVDDLDCSFEEDDEALSKGCLSFTPNAFGKSQSLDNLTICVYICYTSCINDITYNSNSATNVQSPSWRLQPAYR